MDADPGPLDRLDVSALQPFPDARSFEGLVADRLGALAGADAALAGASHDASANPPDGLAPAFAATIIPAADAAANEDAGAPPSPVPGLIEAGDNVRESQRDAQKYLPPVDAPIEQTFDPPPEAPSDLTTPGGVEQGGPGSKD